LTRCTLSGRSISKLLCGTITYTKPGATRYASCRLREGKAAEGFQSTPDYSPLNLSAKPSRSFVCLVEESSRLGRLEDSRQESAAAHLILWIGKGMMNVNISVCHHLQAAFGHARIPEDYTNKDQPGWTGAARWLTRNARLFAKGKLPDERYQLIRNVLGEPATFPLSSPLVGPAGLTRD